MKLLSEPETRFLESTYMVDITGLFLLNRNGVRESPLAVDSPDTPRWPQVVGRVARRGS